MWSESIDACDRCDHAEQGKQQERERKYNDKCIPEPATLWYHKGGCWRIVMPSSQSLDPCCAPDTLLEHHPLASTMFSRLFHVCIPLSVSSSTDLGADIETRRVRGCPSRRGQDS